MGNTDMNILDTSIVHASASDLLIIGQFILAFM